MARRPGFYLSLLAALPAIGCEPEVQEVVAATQVNVRVDASEELRGVITELRATLSVRRGESFEPRSRVTIPSGDVRWPFELPAIPKRERDEGAEFEVVVDAYQGATWLAQTRVTTAFLPRKRAWVIAPRLERCAELCAEASCQGPACRVCAGARCVEVPPRTATEDPNGSIPGDASLDAAASDGGSPGASRDANTLDGNATLPDGAVPSDDASRDGGALDADQRDATNSDASTAADGAADAAVAPDAGQSNDAGPVPCPPNACPAPYLCAPTALGYTCRGRFADWPMPDPVAGAKVAPSYTTSGETVLDNVTKLEWQIGLPSTYAGCTVADTGSGATPQPGELCTRSEGRAYCDALTHGGKSDWRLPSLIEYATLLDGSRATNRAQTNTSYFGDVDTFAFVTDSFGASGPSAIWGINFYIGVTHVVNGYYAKVRCVRGGAEPPFATPAERYAIDTASDTVTDRATGLVWQRTVGATKAVEADVAARCTGGFRVPTPNELLTLVDVTRTMPAIDVAAFPNTPNDVFWASPAAPRKLGVDFADGELSDFIIAASGAYVRCVR